MFDNATPEKQKKARIACIIVIAMLIPAFVVYYEYEIAAVNNIQQVKEHAIASSQPLTAASLSNLTKPSTNTP